MASEKGRNPTRKEVAESYDAIAEGFDLTRRYPWPETVEFLDGLPSGSLVLDVGCGNGRNAAQAIAKRLDIVGIDISKRMLKISGDKCPGACLVLADAVSLPFKAGAFDAAFSVATLHHIPEASERIGALREMGRVLSGGGRALVGVWAREQERLSRECDENGDAWVEWKLPGGKCIGRFYHLFTEAEFKAAMLESGVAIERYFFRCDNHYAVLRRKP